ncbi:hypothetical protein GI374_04435 [Paracoccus sp. S-4012]|uniref:hypothetical protein n=1 Tax=Paracoccus sp. S-4012 TaxID=2665648 RepID=UPI0012B0CD6B|nr:hypothetical protein [Paracoccus sp. S-4012]MRX49707.1 hypothetical protein [Paracoccus sp. S-4012]
MSLALRLESFARDLGPPLPKLPVYAAEDLAAARAEGFAEGRAAAAAEARAGLAVAVSRLTAALADDDARRRELAAGWKAELVAVTEAVAGALAPPFRAALLAESVVRLLAAGAGVAPAPARIGCEPAARGALRAALDAAGLQRVEITDSPSGASFESAGGLIRIDPGRVQRGLEQIIADMKETPA